MQECIKIKFPSKKRAENKLKAIAKQGIIIPENAHAYLCPSCGKWHLGHDRKIGGK